MKLNEIVNFKELIFRFYKKDLQSFINSSDFKVSEKQTDELINIGKTNDIKTLFLGIDNFFNKNKDISTVEFNLMVTLLLQRYHYFQNSAEQWEQYCEQNIDDIVITNIGSFFMDYISNFFETQINFFNQGYLKLLYDFNVDSWSPKFANDLKLLIEKASNSIDFTKKLESTEEVVRYIQDTKNIYSSFEAIGLESEKSIFLAQTNEFKIIFQSMNNLINEILKSLVTKQ